jgi:hypothetical protein
VFFESGPDTVPPRRGFCTGELECNADVVLIPLVRGTAAVGLFLESLVGEVDESAVYDGEADIGAVDKEIVEDGVHLELLGDTLVDGVVAVDEDLKGGIVCEVEGEDGVDWGPVDASDDLANNRTGVDAKMKE